MAARAGVRKQDVIDVAAGLLGRRGSLDDLPLRDVADELGVRTQSLYAHVDGAEGLRRELALVGLRQLADRLGEAAMGRSGAAAVAGIVRAWLDFAADSAGLYAAALRPPGDDAEVGAAMAATMRPLRLVLRSYGLDDEHAGHWYRLIFATVHGFAMLRRDGNLTVHGAPDDTIELMIDTFAAQLASAARP